MKKVDLMVYRDKIKKLHKAAVVLKKVHEDYNDFENNKLLTNCITSIEDWRVFEGFMGSNPDLSDKINEIEEIINELHGV